MLNINDSRIKKVREWIPVAQLESTGSAGEQQRNEEYGTYGVYQVALKSDIELIGDDIIHEKIGYTGESKNIHKRIYTIRQQNGEHGARSYIDANNLDRKNVYVRVLYTESQTFDHKQLEKDIHDKSTDRYGFRFAWKTASGGQDGLYTRTIQSFDKFSSKEMLELKKELEEAYFKKVKEESLERWEEA